MVTYEETYQSYVKFCNMLGQPPLDFESWMHRREEPVKSPFQKTKEFLTQVPQVHA